MLPKQYLTEASINETRVITEVANLYLGDLKSLIENIYSRPSVERRDKIWEAVAAEYPPYEQKIRRLRRTLRKAYLARYNSSLLLNAEMDAHFSKIGDGDAAALLIDILYTRLLAGTGTLRNKKQITEEEKMKEELHIGGKVPEQNTTLQDVIRAILLGRLALPKV